MRRLLLALAAAATLGSGPAMAADSSPDQFAGLSADEFETLEHCVTSPEPDTIIASCTRFIQARGDKPDFMASVFFSRAIAVALHKDDCERAIPDFGEVIRRTKDQDQLITALTLHGFCQTLGHRYGEAVEDYTRALALKPDHDLFVARSKVYDTLGDHVRADRDRAEAAKLPAEN